MTASNAVTGTARADGAAATTAIAVAKDVAAMEIVAMAIAAALNRPQLNRPQHARQSWRAPKMAQSSDNRAAHVRAAAAKFNVTVDAAKALKATADAANGMAIAVKAAVVKAFRATADEAN